jgi:hypothetical protein
MFTHLKMTPIVAVARIAGDLLVIVWALIKQHFVGRMIETAIGSTIHRMAGILEGAERVIAVLIPILTQMLREMMKISVTIMLRLIMMMVTMAAAATRALMAVVISLEEEM